MVYQKFGYLQARILLHKQQELKELELRLTTLDQQYQIYQPTHHRVTKSNDPESEPHRVLMQNIEEKFKEYG